MITDFDKQKNWQASFEGETRTTASLEDLRIGRKDFCYMYHKFGKPG